MRISAYLSIASTVKGRTPDWRMGQTYFNVLTEARPDLAEKVWGTDIDPFFDDKRIVPFLGFLSDNWDEAAS